MRDAILLMSKKETIRWKKMKAWLLIVALIPLFLVKSFHYHDFFTHTHNHSHTEADGATQIVELGHKCLVCDFTLSNFTPVSTDVEYLSCTALVIYVDQPINIVQLDATSCISLRAPPVV